jgi:hypothetical protein
MKPALLLLTLFLVACMPISVSVPCGNGVGCTPPENNSGAGEPNETLCKPEQRQAEFCTEEYAPVCGWNDPAKIQCIRYPCARTYSNACFACANDQVISWTPGECPKGY